MDNNIICSICNKKLSEVSNMFRLSNKDCVCSKKCLFEYSWRYFAIETIKGRPLLKNENNN